MRCGGQYTAEDDEEDMMMSCAEGRGAGGGGGGRDAMFWSLTSVFFYTFLKPRTATVRLSEPIKTRYGTSSCAAGPSIVQLV